MYMVRSQFVQILRHFSSVSRLRRVPWKYKSLAVGQAQQVLTDYLHGTRSLSYTYAEHIAKNADVSLHNLVLKLDFSVPTFAKSLQKYLRYHPINEFEFFFESIGIDYKEVSKYLPPKKFFFSEDRSVLDVACALSGFGFPWNKLGKLYKEESSIFRQSSEEITSKLLKLKGHGFSTFAVIGICLAIPRVLCRDNELNEKIHNLFVNLKKVFEAFDSENSIEDNVDSWYAVFRKLRAFYDLDCETEEIWEMIGRNKLMSLEFSEEVLIQKIEYFCRFGVRKEDVALLILRNPEILSFDLETPIISVTGILKHFGLSEDELNAIAQKYPYVLGRNKMVNLPHVVRALDLQEWFFGKLKNGNHHLLASYSLIDANEDLDKQYLQSLEEIQHSRTPTHTLHKLDFFHRIGFGQNALTMQVLKHAHGTAIELQDRLYALLDSDIEFSKICMLIRLAPKILNQKSHSIERKLGFLCGEMGVSLDYLDVFPAFLCFDLENRIKPRFRCHKWLVEKGLCEQNYSIASMIATSEKAFVARLYGIHPALPKQWFECFSNKTRKCSLRYS